MAVTSRRPHVLRALAALAFAASWVSCARALEMVFAPMRRDVWLGFSSLVGLGGPARALVGSTLSPDIEEVVNAPSTGKGSKHVRAHTSCPGDECCSEGDIVVVDWSLRKSNGYFVDASFGFDPGRGIDEKFGVGSPELRFSPKGDKGDQVIEGIRRALIGMRVGGTRRVIVPPSLGFVKEELKPKPVDWGRQTQIQRAKNKNFVVELRLKALRP
ncbi:Peptidyl-prolyl cis-trans isomerase FKBP16-1 [Durusdinium trenchii]|uniref:peptidylprolyl isomerase n=1 Tax=Durusdinium trenchii TaxID=1381693 RepID=A0ABP0PV43_9DINO